MQSLNGLVTCRVMLVPLSLMFDDKIIDIKGMATHSSILAWRISWEEEPGGPQSIGSKRVGHH